MSRRVVITGLGALTCLGTGVKIPSGTASWPRNRASASGHPLRRDALRSAVHRRDQRLPSRRLFPARTSSSASTATRSSPSCSRARRSRTRACTTRPRTPRAYAMGVSFGTALGGITTAELTHEKLRARKGSKPIPARSPCRSSAAPATATSPSHTACAAMARPIPTAAPPARSRSARPSASSARAVSMSWSPGRRRRPSPRSPTARSTSIKSMAKERKHPETACRPFDRHPQRLRHGGRRRQHGPGGTRHARARGARIYAEVLGYSLNNDAYHMVLLAARRRIGHHRS